MKNIPGRGPRPAIAVEEPPSRAGAAVLATLREAREPLSLARLSAATGLHVNTLRDHLDLLAAGGFVRRRRAVPHGRGRPAWLYAASGRPRGSAVAEYAGLAAVLAELVSRTSDRPWDVSVEVGTGWGKRLAQGREIECADPREVVVEILEELRFAPEADGGQVRLTRCPLLDVARSNPDVVCGVHLGIVRGVLEQLGADPGGTRLLPFVESGACLLSLQNVAR